MCSTVVDLFRSGVVSQTRTIHVCRPHCHSRPAAFTLMSEMSAVAIPVLAWSLVKCGTAECGMRKVKCGIEKCGNGRGMVGKMRNAEKVKWGVNILIIQYLDHA